MFEWWIIIAQSKIEKPYLKKFNSFIKSGKSETRKRRKPQNCFSWVSFFQVFDFEYWVKIKKSEEKKLGKNFQGFPCFWGFQVFDLAFRKLWQPNKAKTGGNHSQIKEIKSAKGARRYSGTLNGYRVDRVVKIYRKVHTF